MREMERWEMVRKYFGTCDGQTPKVAPKPCLLVSISLCDPLPLSVGRTCSSLLNDRIWVLRKLKGKLKKKKSHTWVLLEGKVDPSSFSLSHTQTHTLTKPAPWSHRRASLFGFTVFLWLLPIANEISRVLQITQLVTAEWLCCSCGPGVF